MTAPNYITAILEFNIQDYDLATEILSEWSEAEKKLEGTLLFEVYFASDKSTGTLIETFSDDDAQELHMTNSIANFVPAFLECAEFTSFVYLGKVSNAVKQRVEAFPFLFQNFEVGFRRLP